MLDSLWEMMSAQNSKRGTLLFATRQRFLTFTSMLTFVIAAIWVTLTSGAVVEGRPFVAAACGVTPFLFLPFSYLALRSSLNLDHLAHAFLVLLYLVITCVAAALGGVVSTTSFFLMLIPLLATLLLGIRAGLAWVGVVALTYAALHFGRGALPPSTYEALGTAPLDWMRMEEVSLWNACMMTLLALSASLAVANFRNVVQKSSAMLVDAALETRDAMEARAAAEEISRAKAAFVANVSHELKTPLNAIIGYSELLIEAAQDRDEHADAVDNKRVLDAASRLLSMVNELLRLSAIDAGEHKVSIDECDINALVRDAALSATADANANGNRIVVEPYEEPGFWLCDGPKLGHCLRNLVTNAVTFTQNGAIIIRVKQDVVEGRSWLHIEVADTGVGIDPSLVDKVFLPFALSNSSVARPRAGVGLGLAVVRRLVQLMGGEVSVVSTLGRGSCFTLRAPADFLPDVTAQRRAVAV
jgi:signal transduction histidine kinase